MAGDSLSRRYALGSLNSGAANPAGEVVFIAAGNALMGPQKIVRDNKGAVVQMPASGA
jgi:hypothetical protein